MNGIEKAHPSEAGVGLISFSESSGPCLRRQNRPDFRQHRLNTPAGTARAKVVATELLDEFLIAVDDPMAAFDLGLGREPRRRLLIGSKKTPDLGSRWWA